MEYLPVKLFDGKFMHGANLFLRRLRPINYRKITAGIYEMKLDIPASSTVSHELPIFRELAQDSGLPVSEVKARFHNEMLEKHDELLDDPSKQVMGADDMEVAHSAVNSLRQKLERPEEQPETDRFDDIIGFDPNEPPPGADMFSQPDAGSGFDGFGGGGGGDFGGGAGSGIDNLDLGFSDEGMDAIDSVDSGFDGFGEENTGDSVNAMSEIEPGGEPAETEEGGSEEPPETDNLDDLSEA